MINLLKILFIFFLKISIYQIMRVFFSGLLLMLLFFNFLKTLIQKYLLFNLFFYVDFDLDLISKVHFFMMF